MDGWVFFVFTTVWRPCGASCFLQVGLRRTTGPCCRTSWKACSCASSRDAPLPPSSRRSARRSPGPRAAVAPVTPRAEKGGSDVAVVTKQAYPRTATLTTALGNADLKWPFLSINLRSFAPGMNGSADAMLLRSDSATESVSTKRTFRSTNGGKLSMPPVVAGPPRSPLWPSDSAVALSPDSKVATDPASEPTRCLRARRARFLYLPCVSTGIALRRRLSAWIQKLQQGMGGFGEHRVQ